MDRLSVVYLVTIYGDIMRLLIPLLLLFAIPAHAETVVSPHCFKSCPTGYTDGNTVIVRDIYTLSNNPVTKFADWVAYKVSADTIGSVKPRRWKADPDLLPDDTLEPGDYKGANKAFGTDRGHQGPLASLSATDSYYQTNYLSNITPQKAALNQGSWVRLESRIRERAKELGELYVITGPLYERLMFTLPGADETHLVPSGYWKVVIFEQYAEGFIFDQDEERSVDYCDRKATIKQIEWRTGLDIVKPEFSAGKIVC